MDKSRFLSILSIVLLILHNVLAKDQGSNIPADWVPRVEGGIIDRSKLFKFLLQYN